MFGALLVLFCAGLMVKWFIFDRNAQVKQVVCRHCGVRGQVRRNIRYSYHSYHTQVEDTTCGNCGTITSRYV